MPRYMKVNATSNYALPETKVSRKVPCLRCGGDMTFRTVSDPSRRNGTQVCRECRNDTWFMQRMGF